MRLPIVLFCCYFLLSCATESVRKGPTMSLSSNKVLLLPTTSVQPGIEADCISTYAQVQSNLKDHHFDIISVDQAIFDQVHQAALESTGSIYNPKSKRILPYDRALYMRALINGLREHYYFDVLIDTEIILRPAVMKNHKVSWDGITKKIVVKNQPKGTVLPTEAKGISLRLAAYTHAGGVIKISFAGMALPYDIHFNHQDPDFIIKQVFFVGSDIKDAVKRVLKPFYQTVVVTNDKE